MKEKERMGEVITPIKYVFLNINNVCQYRCDYCWVRKTKGEQLKEAKKVMSLETLAHSYMFFKEYQEKVLKYYPDNELFIIFATKEPLINFDNVIKPFLIKLNKTNKYFKIHFSLLTNGQLLTSEIVSFLEEYGVMVLMSLDGNEESNNTNRLFEKNGVNIAFQETLKGANLLPPSNRHFTFTLNKNTIPFLYDSLLWLSKYPHHWTRFNYNLYSGFTE